MLTRLADACRRPAVTQTFVKIQNGILKYIIIMCMRTNIKVYNNNNNIYTITKKEKNHLEDI